VKGYVRKDGRLVRPTFLLQVKRPDEVKPTWFAWRSRASSQANKPFGR